jgi:serine/threonine protein kinase
LRTLSSVSPTTVCSDEPTHLEVVDFSTLTIGRQIGKGGFATVWTARWQGNNLAVKVLNVELDTIDASTAHQEVAMLQEVAILRRLRHPCICALFGHMRVDQRPALVLEYMAGGSLAAYLFNKSRLPPGEAVQASVSGIRAAWGHLTGVSRLPFAPDAASAPVAPQASLGRQLMEPPPRPSLDDKKMCFAVQLASGLCFLHSNGILHHDIKTDNALLDAHCTVCKLADFGLASLSLNYAHRTSTNSATAGGTLRYTAPEKFKAAQRQARESRDRGDGRGGSSGSSGSSSSLGRSLGSFDDRADVYAFALLLWELSHECRAFEGMTGLAAVFGASQGLRPQFVEPQLYGTIPALTVECWAERPEDRPSMSTVLERLEMCMQALSATQGVGDTSLQTSPRTRPSCFSSSNESLIAAEVGAQCSTKEGGMAEQSHFSSKVGGISLNFEPYVGSANGSASP